MSESPTSYLADGSLIRKTENSMESEILPVRELRIGLEGDDDQWIVLSLCRHDWWEFKWKRGGSEPEEFLLDDMPMAALEMLRDFLNYALPIGWRADESRHRQGCKVFFW